MSTPDLEVTRALEKFEVRVWSDAARAIPRAAAERLGLSAHEIAGGLALRARRVSSLLYNRVFGIGLDRPVDDDLVERAVALYGPGASFAIQPAPIARPAGLDQRLRARGIESWFDWVIWARDARTPIEARPIDVERIGRERADVWVAMAISIFEDESAIGDWLDALIGRAGWSHYIASLEGRLAGVGALFVEGEHAWLGWGGTRVEFRGRGVQGALIARRVRDAAAAGARWVRSETADDLPDRPNASFRNMARNGFMLSYRRPSHLVPPPAPPAGA